MKKALILVNAYSNMKQPFYQAERLKKEFLKLNVAVDVMRNDTFSTFIENSTLISSFSKYDFCVYLDKDKYVLNMLEKCRIKTFNCALAIENCDDKMLTYISLAGNGIPLAKTIPGLLCYTNRARIKKSYIEKIENFLNYPIVVKQSYGSLGKGVYLATCREELLLHMKKLKTTPHLFQEFIKESSGVDYRVIVIGKKAVASMKRVSNGDFRSNISAGGSGICQTPPQEFLSVAEKCAQILNLDYCGVDLLISKDKTPIVCEVNSNAFFDGIEKVSGVNVAKLYAEYIYNEVYNKN